MSAIDNSDLRAKLEAARPLPWVAWRKYDPVRGTVAGISDRNEEIDIVRGIEGRVEDIALLEAAVNALPSLLEAVELHKPMKIWESARSYTLVCRECALHAWPCPTAQILAANHTVRSGDDVL